ncbi:MAG: hypothetical protein FK733_03830 [Asgard group archaeon]|nr:hypothetical protein [Asgard group archaeon]
MSSSTAKTVKTKRKITSAFTGMVIGVFEDNGPIARYHNTRISKDMRNKMVIHGMSAVHGGEDMLFGLFGPLPIFGKENLRYLIYSFKVKASNTKDSRIATHGRVCSVFLILKEKQEVSVLNNHLTIEQKLTDFITEKWSKELDITKDSMISLFDKINSIVKVKELRAFSYGEAGLIEYANPQMILDEGILIIIDTKLSKVYMYLPQEKFDSRTRINAVEKMEELSLREYGSQLKIQKYRDYMKFKKVIDKYAIQLVK